MATNSSRTKYLENMKRDEQKWTEHLRKDRLRKQLYRKKQKAMLQKNKKLLNEKRKTDRARQQLYRKRRKEKIVLVKVEKDIGYRKRVKEKSVLVEADQDIGTYTSRAAFTKALEKVKRSLPKNPAKEKLLLEQLVRDRLCPVVNIKQEYIF